MSENVQIESIKAISDKEQLLNTDTLRTLLNQDSLTKRTEIENALIEKARTLKVVGSLRSLIKAIKKELGASQMSNAEVIDKGFALIDNSNPWECNEQGIFRFRNGRIEIACLGQVKIKELLKDCENNTWYVVLEITRDDQTQEVTVSRQTITDIKKITSLAQYGLGVTSRTANNLLDYFTFLEFNRDNPIEQRASTSHFGWHGTVFVPCDKEIVFAGHPTLEKIKKAINEHGDIEAWIDMYKEIRQKTNEYYEPQLFVSAALASVLIGPLKMYPFILNKWDTTGTGKTVALRLAASVWGDPQEYISDSDSTKNAMIARASILYDLPICIDDFAKAIRDESQLSELIYSLSAGREKDRLDSESNLRNRREWHGCSLTTNEYPLVTDEMRGGAMNRVIDIQGTSGNIFEDPGKVYRVCSQNYGFFGPLFIDCLNAYEDILQKFEIGISNTLKSLEEAAAKQHMTIEGKQLLPLALILVTDAFIADKIFKDNIRLNPGKLLEQLRSREDVSDGQRAYNDILDFISANKGRFVKMGVHPLEPLSFIDVYGYLDNDEKYVHFIPAQFQKLMNDRGRNIKAFCRWAKDHNALVGYKGNQNQKCIYGRTQKVYTIALDYSGEDNEVQDITLFDEIPF